MTTRGIAIGAAVVALAGGGSSLALARSGATSHRYDVTLVARVVSTHGSPPAPGSQEIEAATLDGKIAGRTIHGAMRAVVTYHGPNPPTTRVVEFGPDGSWSSKSKVVPEQNGVFHADGTFTGGTGAYRGASGSFKAIGTTDSNGVFTIHRTGTLKY